MPTKPSPSVTALAVASVLGLTVVAYLPSLSVPFQFDDYARISGNWNLHEGNWGRAIRQLGGVRVLPATTLAANFWWGGEETGGYHVVNLIIHLLATWAVFRMARLIALVPRLSGSAVATHPLFFAGSAAVVFAVHPLQTQAVTYIVQRFASMAALFYVLCVAEYLAARLAQIDGAAGRARLHFVLALVAGSAALLSKENAVTLPLAILLVEVAAFGRAHVGALLRRGLWVAPLLVVPLLWKWLGWRSRRNVEVDGSWFEQMVASLLSQSPDSPAQIGPFEYLLTQMVVVPRYLGLVMWPTGLNVDHDVPTATAVTTEVALGAALLLALFALGVWALRKSPLIGFGILWFFVTLSVESTLIPIHDVMMEHRVYLAMPGLALIVGDLACRAAQIQPRWAVSGVVVLALVLAGATYARNQVWQSALSLWSDAASKSPNKARVHVNVGVAHHALDQLDRAIEHYCRAIALDDEIPVARDNIEIALEQQGRLEEITEQLTPRQVKLDQPIAGLPEGAIVLDYDPSEIVCAP